MERLKFEECKNCRDWKGNVTDCFANCMKPFEALEEFNTYKTLDEQGQLLKNPEKLKHNILGRMEEFAYEYRSYSESCMDYDGGRAEAMEAAIRIVKTEFSKTVSGGKREFHIEKELQMLNLGEMVKKERINLGLSQQKLADEAGVTKRAINYWEAGKKNMSVESADKVFRVLHMSITIGAPQSKI